MRTRSSRYAARFAAAALALALVPAGMASAEEIDHGQTTVVGPTEQRQFANASSGSGDDIVFNGRGSYHSVGMSQHGAHARAIDGRTATEIVTSYYRGTSVALRPPDHDIRVAVLRDAPRVRVVAVSQAMVVRAGGYLHTIKAGKGVDVTVDSNGKCTLRTVTDPGGGSESTSALETAVQCPTFDPGARAEVFQPSGSSGWKLYGAYGRDALVDLVADLVTSNYRIDTVVQLPLEEYLYGLAEVPYSWDSDALQAQAIAGRSYALNRMLARGPSPDSGCSCHVWDSQQDQVYRGYEREVSAQWARWRAAVDATEHTVVVAAPSQEGYDSGTNGVVQAFYSASSHGRTENKHEVFYPSTWDYMVSVEDVASLEAPNNWWADWTVRVPRSTVASKVGLSSVDHVEVVERRASGSARTVEFRGGGSTVTMSADEVRWTFGLYSNGFGIGDEVWGDPPPPSDLFDDDDGNTHEDSIDWLANAGITSGCNPPANDKYCPGDPVTRAQMATFLRKALDLPVAPEQFSDVGESNVHADSIGALAKAGITAGCNPPTNDQYCPYEPVTRAQMATFLRKALDLPVAPEQFSDVGESNVHADSIGALAKAGITAGCNPPTNDQYCPYEPVTRAQMATFLKRALT